jgi:hypothetical protein
MLRRKALGALALYAIILPAVAFGQSAVYSAPQGDIDRIKSEGIDHSQVMQTLSYLSDVIGPRLTASPGMKRANEWTRDTLASWGMQNAHLEPWGPFGRGWTLKRFSAMVDGPTAFPLIAYPKAWSPGTDTLIPAPKPGKKTASPAGTVYTADVVHFAATKEEELDQYKGKLKGKIVLVGPLRDIKAHFEPEGKRLSDTELLDLADAPQPGPPAGPRPQTPVPPSGTPVPTPTPNPQFAAFIAQQQFNAKRMQFLVDEGAAILIDGARGDGGTIFVQQAAALQPTPNADGTPGQIVRLYDKDAKIPIQISAAGEHFNRVARMVDAGEKVTMSVDLAVEYQDTDPNGYNTIAEIPGTDKADEIVMIGGHLDSWQSGTGATDNGAGCAVMMEAMRILQTLGLKPRRTIRIALWTGEEQGLLGSRQYVAKHFGYMGAEPPPVFGGRGGSRSPSALTKLAEYDKFQTYFNIDNGTGKIRGVYMQGNDGVRPIFREWLEPFKGAKWYSDDKDMSANTLTLSNTGGTDHLAFDAIGLPGFQFIQDPVEYGTRTHHSNMDVFDRIQADDMKQMSIIVAAFAYQAAMMDDKMPRKPVR